jgi:large subunit ribosomal protein L46
MRRTIARHLFNQHRTPVSVQLPISAAAAEELSQEQIRVGYLLHRNPVVRHDPHPLETEHSYLLEREHQRYCRHEGHESAVHFFQGKGQSLDAAGRQDPGQITSNFFSLEMYQDSLKAVVDRFKLEPRVTPLDLWDPRAEQEMLEPPARHSLNRRLDDYLLLIVLDAQTGKWTVPSEERTNRETLRMTADRAILDQHGDAFDAYIWSNSPSGVVVTPGEDADKRTRKLFLFSVTYLSGKPRFGGIRPAIQDHAWVTRRELLQYRQSFTPGLVDVLFDIAPIGGAVEHS